MCPLYTDKLTDGDKKTISLTKNIYRYKVYMVRIYRYTKLKYLNYMAKHISRGSYPLLMPYRCWVSVVDVVDSGLKSFILIC